MKRILCVILLCLAFLQTAQATTGGDDWFEILGVDTRAGKIFFSIIDGDGSGFIDSVHYINIQSSQTFFAKSLYQTGRIEDCYDKCAELYHQRLNRIKKSLTPLTEMKTAHLRWHIIKQSQSFVDWNEEPTPEHKTFYQVVFDDGKKTLKGQGRVTYYLDEFRIYKAFKLPNDNAMVVVLEYLGKPYEFGYKKYDVILLKPEK